MSLIFLKKIFFCNSVRKEIPTHVFSCEYCNNAKQLILENTSRGIADANEA